MLNVGHIDLGGSSKDSNVDLGLNVSKYVTVSSPPECLADIAKADAVKELLKKLSPKELIQNGQYDSVLVWHVARSIGVSCKGNWLMRRDVNCDKSRCRWCRQPWSAQHELPIVRPRCEFATICGCCDSAGRCFRPELRSESAIAALGSSDMRLFLEISAKKRKKRAEREEAKKKKKKKKEEAELRAKRRR